MGLNSRNIIFSNTINNISNNIRVHMKYFDYSSTKTKIWIFEIAKSIYAEYWNMGNILSFKKGYFKFRIKDHLESIKCTLSGSRRIKKNNANAYK